MNLPNDIKQTCLWIVRGQKRREKWYNEQRYIILNGSPCPFTTYKKDNKEIRQYYPHSNKVGNPVANKTEQIEKLEQSEEYKRLVAVNSAIETIGNDVCTESKERLKKAILLNCESGRKYPFEKLDITEFSRRDFYNRKDRFLYELAKKLNFL